MAESLGIEEQSSLAAIMDLATGMARAFDVFVWLRYNSKEEINMESNYKKIAVSSIIAISLSLFLSGSGLFFDSIAKADDEIILAEGDFTAIVDFFTLTLTPVRNKCLLEVEGVLFLTGTLEGEAYGTTRALVFATCDQVAITPPGTFMDVFKSKLQFDGTVNGEATMADITYLGITEIGGDIKGRMILSNGLEGLLKVDARVAESGNYAGFLKIEDDDDD